ncbi:sporulation histidine kinase inhibitor Sda [Evansella tamaricis]|uniref:Sporulation histidine kinase inhibitor Sda n=1 Tax=Evansella tamaricis TaxID=2069301 RepID=A0ABS6JA50_9BACI|nr:sporulation histidine kinase inhibitor Sda [Evansella tamaricis]MBU9710566.1 sporulation histidine kinase inhibitor Sda [Evansella tamaricis]
MRYLNDEKLIEIYQIAVNSEIDSQFLQLVIDELKRREINLNNIRETKIKKQITFQDNEKV